MAYNDILSKLNQIMIILGLVVHGKDTKKER